MSLVGEIIKFVFYTLIIIGISKYILVYLLRNLAETLQLKPKTVGNISGIATSIPELLTISLASIAGLTSVSIFNIISSNVINFVQYFLSMILNKNIKSLRNKAILVDLVLSIITIIIPIFLIHFDVEVNMWLILIFIVLLFLFYQINGRYHKKYLLKYEQLLDSEILEEESKRKDKKKIIYYIIGILLSGVLLFFVGNQLSNALENLCNFFGIPEFILGIILGIATSIPELITFFEAQRYHKQSDIMTGVVEATNNLLTSNMLNLFLIQSIGILLFTIFH